jgi:hypothetical protein
MSHDLLKGMNSGEDLHHISDKLRAIFCKNISYRLEVAENF